MVTLFRNSLRLLLFSTVLSIFEFDSQATDLVNNLANSAPDSEAIFSGQADAQGFTTDGSIREFTGLTVRLAKDTATDGIFNVELRSDSGGSPGTVLESWTGNTISSPQWTSSADFTFNSTGGVTLGANTKYWVIVHVTGGGAVNWTVTSTQAQAGSGTVNEIKWGAYPSFLNSVSGHHTLRVTGNVIPAVVDNLANSAPEAEAIFSGQTDAQGFTTDARAYRFAGLTVRLGKDGATDGNYDVELRSDSGGSPGAIIESWSGNSITSPVWPSTTDFTFTSAGGITLAANTKYWVIVHVTGGGGINWTVTSTLGQAGPGMVNELRWGDYPNFGNSASGYHTFSVQGTALQPELAIVATDAQKAEGNSGTTAFTFSVSRTVETSGTTSVDYSVTGSGGNPADAADFGGSLPSGTVNFSAGEANKLITVDVSGDSGVEFDELFTVTLSGPTGGAVINTGSATGTIENDDSAFEIGATAGIAAEGDTGSTTLLFEVVRAGTAVGVASVDFAVSGSGGAAADAGDFGGSLPSGTLSFADGEQFKLLQIEVSGDLDLEPDESFTVSLSNPVGAPIGVGSASGTILSDDVQVDLNVLSGSEVEGDTGSATYVFEVLRGGASGIAFTVDYAVSGSGTSPAIGNDFVGGVLASGTLNFAAGQSFETVLVEVAGDTEIELNEEFTLTLSNPTAGVRLGTASRSATIVDDDDELIVSNVANGGTEGEVLAGTSKLVAQSFQTDASGYMLRRVVLALEDFAAGSSEAMAEVRGDNNGIPGMVLGGLGTASFNGFANVQFTTATGPTLEPNTKYWVVLKYVSGNFHWRYTTDFGTTGPGSLPNDDSVSNNGGASWDNDSVGDALRLSVHGVPIAPTAIISIAPVAGAVGPEGDSALTIHRYAVTRIGNITGAMSVDYAVTGTGPNPAEGDDFNLGGAMPMNTLNFAAGVATLTLDVVNRGDHVVELDEGFTVTLSNPSGGAALGTATATGTIQNDDTATISISGPGSVTEGNSGTSTASFTIGIDTVNLIPPFTPTVDVPVRVTLDTQNGTATAGGDFVGIAAQEVTIPAGQTSVTVDVIINGDTQVEFPEDFSLTLRTPLAAGRSVTINGASATATIENDDSAFEIGATAGIAAEGDTGSTTLLFEVVRAGTAVGVASVDFAVSGSGGAPADAGDFGGSLPSGTLSFAAGEQFKLLQIEVSGDLDLEPDESFTVSLSNPVGAPIGVGSASGTILNDDAVIELVASPMSLKEGDSGTTTFFFDLVRSGFLGQAASVSYTVAGHGANPANAADFGGSMPAGTVSFAFGESAKQVVVNVSGDTEIEGHEFFTLNLANPIGATLTGGAVPIARIETDDFSPAQALINNFSQNSGAFHSMAAGAAFAQAFSTDDRPWIFRSVDLLLSGSSSSVRVELRADDAGQPGDVVETIPVSVNNGTSLGPVSASSVALPELRADTRYWLVLHCDSGAVAAGEAFTSANSGVGTVGALKRAGTFPTFDEDEASFLIMILNASTIAPAPVAQPELEIIGFAGGIAEIELRGAPNTSYEIDFSDVLAGWQLLRVVTTDAGGTVLEFDTGSLDKPQRFYRARSVQP